MCKYWFIQHLPSTVRFPTPTAGTGAPFTPMHEYVPVLENITLDILRVDVYVIFSTIVTMLYWSPDTIGWELLGLAGLVNVHDICGWGYPVNTQENEAVSWFSCNNVKFRGGCISWEDAVDT